MPSCRSRSTDTLPGEPDHGFSMRKIRLEPADLSHAWHTIMFLAADGDRPGYMAGRTVPHDADLMREHIVFAMSHPRCSAGDIATGIDRLRRTLAGADELDLPSRGHWNRAMLDALRADDGVVGRVARILDPRPIAEGVLRPLSRSDAADIAAIGAATHGQGLPWGMHCIASAA